MFYTGEFYFFFGGGGRLVRKTDSKREILVTKLPEFYQKDISNNL